MGRQAGGPALYLKQIHWPFLILVYQRIGSVEAPNSTKNGRNHVKPSKAAGVSRQPVCPPSGCIQRIELRERCSRFRRLHGDVVDRDGAVSRLPRVPAARKAAAEG